MGNLGWKIHLIFHSSLCVSQGLLHALSQLVILTNRCILEMYLSSDLHGRELSRARTCPVEPNSVACQTDVCCGELGWECRQS